MLELDLRLQALSSDIDLDDVVLAEVRVNVAQSDCTPCHLVGENGLGALALGQIAGDHRSAGDPAGKLSVPVDFHARAHDAAVNELDCLDALGNSCNIGEVLVLDAQCAFLLDCEGFASYEGTLLFGEVDCKACKRHCEDRHALTAGVLAHLMTVERIACFKAKSIAGSQSCRLCPELYQPVP